MRHSAVCSVPTLPGCEECRIAVRYPVAEGKAADENRDASKDRIEEIEGSHRADADEVEQCALHAQVRERLMQTLEYPVCALLLLWVIWHKFLA